MNRHSDPPQASYHQPLDAIVLAGTDTNPRRMVRGRNKAFLEVGGKTLVRRVVEALEGAETIGGIFVVGPKEELLDTLDGASGRLEVVQQKGHILPNTLAALHASEAACPRLKGEADPERPLLVISCDLPLISSPAVDDFVARCALEDEKVSDPYAILAGVAEETCLSRYYPREGRSGIVRPYVHFHTVRARLANIYVGRPRKLDHQEFLQTGFSYRKAKDWHNVLRLTWSFFKQSGGWKAAWLTLRYQATLMASRRGGWLYHRLRRNNDHEKVEQVTSVVLGGNVRMVVTPYGGLSLDVDDEEDYRVLSENFERWKDIDPVPQAPA